MKDRPSGRNYKDEQVQYLRNLTIELRNLTNQVVTLTVQVSRIGDALDYIGRRD